MAICKISSPQITYILYLEFLCVCPLVRIGTPTPSPPSECVPSNGTKRGETPSPADEGVGESQFGRLEKKPITLSTVWSSRITSTQIICHKMSRMQNCPEELLQALPPEFFSSKHCLLWYGKMKTNFILKF
jgi:hypothetical protein